MHCCPNCKVATNLFVTGTIPAWRAIDPESLKPKGSVEIDFRDDFEDDGIYGCGECEWQGTKKDIEAT